MDRGARGGRRAVPPFGAPRGATRPGSACAGRDLRSTSTSCASPSPWAGLAAPAPTPPGSPGTGRRRSSSTPSGPSSPPVGPGSRSLLLVAAPGRGREARTLRSLHPQTAAGGRPVVVGAPAPADDPRVTAGGAAVGGSPCGPTRSRPPDEFVLVLEAGDLCEPDLVFAVAAAVWEQPTVDVVHWDDDLPRPTAPSRPPFRPSWSPDMLLSANYLGRSFAVRRRRSRRAASPTCRRRRPLVGPPAAPRPRRRAGAPDAPGARPPRPSSRAAPPTVVGWSARTSTAAASSRRSPCRSRTASGAGPLGPLRGRGLDRDPDPPQPSAARPLPDMPRGHRLPAVDVVGRRQRRPHAGQRGLVQPWPSARPRPRASSGGTSTSTTRA